MVRFKNVWPKYALSVFIILSSGLGSSASSQEKWIRDLIVAKEKSRVSGKPLLVKYEASWCEPCKLQDVDFAKPINANLFERYIMAKIDVDSLDLSNKGGSKTLKSSVGLPLIEIYSSVNLASPEKSIKGYNPAVAIVEQIDTAIAVMKQP